MDSAKAILTGIDWFVRRMVGYPIVIVGSMLTDIAAGFICLGALLLEEEEGEV